MGIFSIDGGFAKWANKVLDMMIAALLTIVIGIASVTILLGPALTAFFYVTDKVIVHERGYLVKNYFKSFKQNLGKGIALGLLLTAGYSVVGFVMANNDGSTMLIIGMYLALAELTIIACYGFILLAKFEMTLKDIVTKALLYGHRHLLTTIVIISVVGIVAWLTTYAHAIFLLIGSGFGAYIVSRLVMERVLPNYVDRELLVQFERN